MVSGTARLAAGSPCSRTARASSSTNNGLPSAFATMRAASASEIWLAPSTDRKTRRLSSGASGRRATCVA